MVFRPRMMLGLGLALALVTAVVVLATLNRKEASQGDLSWVPDEKLMQSGQNVIDAQLRRAKHVNAEIQVLRELAAEHKATGKWLTSEQELFARRKTIPFKYPVRKGVKHDVLKPGDVYVKRLDQDGKRACYQVTAFGIPLEKGWIDEDYH